MGTDHEASSAWTDLARWQKKDPVIGPIVRGYRLNTNAKPSLSSVAVKYGYETGETS